MTPGQVELVRAVLAACGAVVDGGPLDAAERAVERALAAGVAADAVTRCIEAARRFVSVKRDRYCAPGLPEAERRAIERRFGIDRDRIARDVGERN